MGEFHTFILDNGIRCVHRRTKSPVANIALTINSGTRDELPREHGVAHLVEHLLFKGTSKRTAYQVNSRLDGVGGELNAFTTKEETVLHASCLKADLARGVELLADMIFNSSFEQRELEKEREIIIDEINSYKDSPSELIFDEFEELHYADSPLGRNILGSKRELMKIEATQVRDYVRRNYTTDQIVFSVSSSATHERFEFLARRYLGDVSGSTRATTRLKPCRVAPFSVERNRRTYQTHCVLGGESYSLYDSKRVVFALLTNVLGGGSSLSRLNQTLREKRALTYNVEANYTPYTDSGVYTIYFGSENEKADQCRELVEREIAIIKTKLLTTRELSSAKRQFVGQLALSSDSNESFMLAIAKSLLVFNEFDTNAAIAAKIETISALEIADVANEIFVESNINRLIYR